MIEQVHSLARCPYFLGIQANCFSARLARGVGVKETLMAQSQTPCVKIRNRIYETVYFGKFNGAGGRADQIRPPISLNQYQQYPGT
jgi:hypothetical protein